MLSISSPCLLIFSQQGLGFWEKSVETLPTQLLIFSLSPSAVILLVVYFQAELLGTHIFEEYAMFWCSFYQYRTSLTLPIVPLRYRYFPWVPVCVESLFYPFILSLLLPFFWSMFLVDNSLLRLIFPSGLRLPLDKG